MRAQCDSFSQMNYSVNGNHLNTFSLIRCLFLAHLFAVVYMVHSNAINPLLITQFILMFLFLLRAFLQSFCYIFLFPFFLGTVSLSVHLLSFCLICVCRFTFLALPTPACSFFSFFHSLSISFSSFMSIYLFPSDSLAARPTLSPPSKMECSEAL